jgi:hypothetical protein
MPEYWTDFASEDAARAYAAIWGLVANPQKSVGLLGEQLYPVRSVPDEKIKELIADLLSRWR